MYFLNRLQLPFFLGNDTTLCGTAVLNLDISQPNATSYLWSDNSTNSTFTISTPGLYWGEVSNLCGTTTNNIQVEYNDQPQISLGNDSTLCEGESLFIDASWPDATYIWDDFLTTPTRNITTSGIYQVTLFHHCGDIQEEIAVDFVERPEPVFLGPDLTLCEGEEFVLEGSQNQVLSYLWQDGSTDPDYIVRFDGLYKLSVSNECGEETDEVDIRYLPTPKASFFSRDTILCEDDEFVLDVSQGQSVTYTWQDGSTLPNFIVNQGGNYFVNVENDCGIAADTVSVEQQLCFCNIYSPNAFTPNADGNNDQFRIQYQCDIISGTLKIFNRWGNLVFQTNNPEETWDGTSKGTVSPEGVYAWVFEYQFYGINSVRGMFEHGSVTLFR